MVACGTALLQTEQDLASDDEPPTTYDTARRSHSVSQIPIVNKRPRAAINSYHGGPRQPCPVGILARWPR